MNRSKESEVIPTSKSLYALRTASKLSDISVFSIRQYIDNGLILPYVTDTNRHLFTIIDILRLKYIKKQLSENGLNIAGIKAMYSLIPCWSIHQCPTFARENCAAYFSGEAPCWEASKKEIKCKNKDCRNCDVYKFPEESKDLKAIIKKHTI